MSFVTDAGVFSRGEIDTGTRVLLEALPEEITGNKWKLLLSNYCGEDSPLRTGNWLPWQAEVFTFPR